MGNCDFSLPALPTNNKTPGRACYSTRCFVVCPNSVPIKNRVFGLYFNGGGEGSRTPVRRWVDRTFSGCRRLLEFPVVRHQSANAAPRYLFVCLASSKEKGKRTFITQFDARFCAVILAEGTGGINGRGTAVRLPMLLVC